MKRQAEERKKEQDRQKMEAEDARMREQQAQIERERQERQQQQQQEVYFVRTFVVMIKVACRNSLSQCMKKTQSALACGYSCTQMNVRELNNLFSYL